MRFNPVYGRVHLAASLRTLLAPALATLLVCLAACRPAEPPASPLPPLDPKGKAAVSMRGYNFTRRGIAEFHVNGAGVSNLPEYGGGGKDTCCAMLPNRWTPELRARVDWTVTGWTIPYEQRMNMSLSELVRCCVREQSFSVEVPVQRYERPATLQVFFLEDDKVQVWVSDYDLGHPSHPSGRHYPRKPEPAPAAAAEAPQGETKR
ncbi:MAG: DUF3304 domain-containing protein [Bordetella sp.]|nr:DUF3304 domain-containing protein [Bordetella sp.]